MKIMLVVPHLSDGGGERVVSALTFGLQAEELVLVVFQRRAGYPYKGRLLSLDMPIERKSLFSRGAGFIKRIIRFKQVLKQERPDVVVSFMGEANLINALLSPRPIVTVHNHLSSLADLVRSTGPGCLRRVRKRLESAVVEFLIRLLYRRATVVAVAEPVKRELVQRFRIPENQVLVISNAVDAQAIQEKSAEAVSFPWSPDRPVVITVGRLTAEKGQWHLIRSFAQVRRQMPCQLVILGTGDLEGYLRSLAADLGIANDVLFLGWQANPFKLLSGADLFVLSSITEAFGLVVLEAMACGLAVISSDCPGGLRDIIAPGTIRKPDFREAEYASHGVLVPAHDGQMLNSTDPPTVQEHVLSDAMLRMLQDESLRSSYSRAGLERVRDYDHGVFIERYQRLIEHVSGWTSPGRAAISVTRDS